MAYNENINLFVATDRNNADVFNAPLEKIIQNIEDTRAYLNQLQLELDQLESRVQSEYTPTEQLNDLLATGIKGDKGDTGTGLEFNWDNTSLGVKREDETDYQYVDLKGDTGSIEGIAESHILLERVEISSGVDLNSLYDVNKVYITTTNNIARQCTNIPKSNITSFELRTYKTTYEQGSRYLMQTLKTYKNELWIRGHDGYDNTWTEWKQMATNDDIANINIPTTLPASDVYDWAKAPTKPTYAASEVGALASNGTAVSASKVEKALTLKIAGTTKNTFDGSTAQFFDVPNATTSAAGVMTAAMVTKLNGIATGANLIKTSKNTAKFSSQSAFSPAISSCIIGNNTVGGVWVFTGYITYNISSAPSANASILSINQQMTQSEDVTIICPCMTANNAYITLKVSGGTLYYQSYTGSAPTSGSRYFVSAVIPVSSTSFLS